ncbi:MAG: signal peptidase II [Pseudohongiellaceae bacterium]
MWYYLLSLAVIVLDQVLKKYMSAILPLCEPGYCRSIEILPVFQFTLLHNTGAAFSFLSDAGGWQRWFLGTVSIVVSLVIAIWLFRIRLSDKLLALALALILGGAVGNLIDRLINGYVVDFIVVHYKQWYFPAFNVADAAISVGAALLILDMLLKSRSEARHG